MSTPVTPVPYVIANVTPNEVPPVDNPYLLNAVWWAEQTLSDIPPHAVGWLVANGWRVTRTVRDNTTVPPTVYYDMQTDQLDPDQVLLSLCNSFTLEANYARTANNDRYTEVTRSWQDMIESTNTHATNETELQNECLGVYITDLNNLQDIDDLLASNRDSLDRAYDDLETNSNLRLDGLGTTELARITEHFAATLSVQLQGLTDRGLYTSALAADITARNERDRDEQIQQLNDRINRERLQNDHQLFAADSSLSQFKQQAIVQQLNVKVTQLEGRKRVHDDNMRLMAYQLDTRNQLLIGLYGFVERREDIGPRWENMSSMIAALGEAGGGSWVQP